MSGELWDRLLRLIDAPRLSVFKLGLDNVPSNMLLVSPNVVRPLDSMIFDGPFQMNNSILKCLVY